MADSVTLNILVQRRQAKLDSFEQQKQAVESQLNTLNSNAAAAEVTLGDKKMSLSEAVVTLSNFTIPDIIDQPDRSAFVSNDEETGEEVFDSAGFDAADRAYQESVKAHEEAVRQKAELEQAVQAKTQEVAGAEADYNTLVQTAQEKENELAAVDENMNMSMREIEDLNAEIAELEAQKESLPKGENEYTYIDPQTGMQVTETVIDGKKIVKSVEVDPNNPDAQKVTVFRDDGVTVVTNKDGNEVTSRFALSQDGNVAEYDGKGNTVITVKAGESAGIIYNKFFGDNEANAQNRENLIEQFRQKATVNGERVPADFNPTEAQLKQFFYKVSGFNSDGTRLANGRIIQAGQDLTIPTEIHPDNVNLQNRNAEVEKARGNAAEAERQARAKAAQMAQDAEANQLRAFKDAFVQELKLNAEAMNKETAFLNKDRGSHPSGNIISDEVNRRMQEGVQYSNSKESFDDLAYDVRLATGGRRFAEGENSRGGTLSVRVSGQDIEQLYYDAQRLAKEPDNKELARSVQQRWDSYTMRNFVKEYNVGRAEDAMLGRFIQTVTEDLLTAFAPEGATKTGTYLLNSAYTAVDVGASAAMSAADGNSVGGQIVDMLITNIPFGSTVKAFFTEKVVTNVYENLGNSQARVTSCLRNLANLDQQEQEKLANMLRGKTDEQKARIIEAYSSSIRH